jgi:hypothetical protein
VIEERKQSDKDEEGKEGKRAERGSSADMSICIGCGLPKAHFDPDKPSTSKESRESDLDKPSTSRKSRGSGGSEDSDVGKKSKRWRECFV